MNSLLTNSSLSSMIHYIYFMAFLLVSIGAISVSFEILNEKRKIARVKGEIKINPLVGRIQQMALLKGVAKNIHAVLRERDAEDMYSIVFGCFLLFVILTTGFLLFMKQLLLGVLAPFFILKVTNELCYRMITDLSDNIEEQLPVAIDNIIRISSKYGDLKSIIYESSRTCPQPMKKIMGDMSREMLSDSPDRVLMKHARRYDNVWFYSVVFVLISYLEDSSKTETIKNLKSLREILDKENYTKKANVQEKRYGMVINLAICGIAILGFFFNLFFTPGAREFFFGSLGGLACFLGGIGCIILTLFTSIGMSKARKG